MAIGIFNSRVRVCTVMLRCDGARLVRGHEMCAACRAAMQPKKPKTLKGTSKTDSGKGAK
jgi:hypothetical protein